MKTEIADHDEDGCGVRVFDDEGNEHQIALSWDGEVTYHGTDDYPHDPADRTQEEQAIMSQVEARAKYEAQQAFPDADILDPMWDPHHLERGLEALANLPLDVFHEQFRDYYDALRDPYQFAKHDREDIVDASLMIVKVFTVTPENRMDEVSDAYILYNLTDGTEVTRVSEFHGTDRYIELCHPNMEFADDFVFEENFHEMMVAHIMAQIRDIYLNMGEDAPEEYVVQGYGKLTINGDGIDTREFE